MTEDKDHKINLVYKERNLLLALLTRNYQSCMSYHHEDEPWDDEWRTIVNIKINGRWLSWHIHDSEVKNFKHVPRIPVPCWDGHTTKEKYEWISEYVQRIPVSWGVVE